MHFLAPPPAPSPPYTGKSYASTPSASLLAPAAFSLSTTPTPLKARFYTQQHYADFYIIPAPAEDSPLPTSLPTSQTETSPYNNNTHDEKALVPPPPRSTSPDLTRFQKPRFSKRLNGIWVEKEKMLGMVEVQLTAREMGGLGMVRDLENGRRNGKRELGVMQRARRVDMRVWVMVWVLAGLGMGVMGVGLLVLAWGA